MPEGVLASSIRTVDWESGGGKAGPRSKRPSCAAKTLRPSGDTAAAPKRAAPALLRYAAPGTPTMLRREPEGASNTIPEIGPERLRSEEHTSELQSRLHLVCR